MIHKLKRFIIYTYIIFITAFAILLFYKSGYLNTMLYKTNVKSETPIYKDSYKSWENCLSQLDIDADIAFVGDSITANGNFQDFFADKKVVNLGYYGDRIVNIRERINMIKIVSPSDIFIMVGVNSLACRNVDYCINQYKCLLDELLLEFPKESLHIISVLPCCNDNYAKKNDIIEFNAELEKLCVEHYITFIDMYTIYANNSGYLPTSMSNDGLHLKQDAYESFYHECAKYIN